MNPKCVMVGFLCRLCIFPAHDGHKVVTLKKLIKDATDSQYSQQNLTSRACDKNKLSMLCSIDSIRGFLERVNKGLD